MAYMLDTNIVSEMIRNPAGRAAQRARKEANLLRVSIIVTSELRYGCHKKGSQQLSRKVEQFLSRVTVLAFDAPADDRYGILRVGLEAAGLPIGSNDLFIAAHALAVGATLVTANVDEFRRVGGLSVENWMV